MINDNLDEPVERLVTPESKIEEEIELNSLRPTVLDDFIGQTELKSGLKIFIEAALKRGEPIEHVLLYGNPGLGKTTLAHIIAKEMGGNLKVTSGPALERVGDLAAVLSNLGKGDVLFIDEIHRINKTIEEVLYPAMEDYALDIMVGKGPTARILRLNLEPFTIIGATTRLSLLSAPLRDRFGSTFHLNFYSTEEMRSIVDRSARILKLTPSAEAISLIAERARRTPRIGNRLLKRARDYAEVKNDGDLSREAVHEALKMLQIDELGLDKVDRFLLETMIDKFNGGPVGLNTLSAATQEDMATIEEVYEPYLIQIGFLDRTPRGRMVTGAGYEHLGRQKPTGGMF